MRTPAPARTTAASASGAAPVPCRRPGRRGSASSAGRPGRPAGRASVPSSRASGWIPVRRSKCIGWYGRPCRAECGVRWCGVVCRWSGLWWSGLWWSGLWWSGSGHRGPSSVRHRVVGVSPPSVTIARKSLSVKGRALSVMIGYACPWGRWSGGPDGSVSTPAERRAGAMGCRDRRHAGVRPDAGQRGTAGAAGVPVTADGAAAVAAVGPVGSVGRQGDRRRAAGIASSTPAAAA